MYFLSSRSVQDITVISNMVGTFIESHGIPWALLACEITGNMLIWSLFECSNIKGQNTFKEINKPPIFYLP